MKRIIKYNVPEISAEEAAAKTVAALKSVEMLGGDSLYYCAQASNVLSLAGLRSVSQHTRISNDFTDEKIQKLDEVLKEHGCRAFLQDDHNYSSDERSLAIINEDMLCTLENYYPVLHDMLPAPSHLSWARYKQWSTLLMSYLAGQMDDVVLPKKWLSDWWTPHHLAFGIVLGHPGVALSDSSDRVIGELDRNVDMDIVSIEIETSDIYDGVDIAYAVNKDHIADPEIRAHSKLWYETLNHVYTEFTDEKMLSVPGFKEEQKRVKNMVESR